MAIRYKWETYGFVMYSLQSSVYFGITMTFTIACILPDVIPGYEPFRAGGELWYLLNIVRKFLAYFGRY